MTSSADILELKGLTREYGGLVAVADVDLRVAHGARIAMIGPNGAGKSTLLGLIGGTIRPSSGTIHSDGEDITKLSVSRRSQRGIVKTFQHSSLFDEVSAHENVRVALRRRLGISTSLFGGAKVFRAMEEQSRHYLDMTGLQAKSDVLAGALSHGERRALDLAIALALEPRLLLLDEPMAGMTKGDSERLTGLIRALPRTITILLVEHDMDVVFNLAEEVVAMASGRVIERGTPAAIQASDAVQEVYLGSTERGEFFYV
ncbi:MAG: transporter ATP-binding protein [Cryobacterium sp.]|jgi:branched-chain amino acid transport system ATP-binding protein|nr:transporter ATP-binding protein [Cryobacterium sp.]